MGCYCRWLFWWASLFCVIAHKMASIEDTVIKLSCWGPLGLSWPLLGAGVQGDFVTRRMARVLGLAIVLRHPHVSDSRHPHCLLPGSTTARILLDPCATLGNDSRGSLWSLELEYKERTSEGQFAWARWRVSWQWVPGLCRKRRQAGFEYVWG